MKYEILLFDADNTILDFDKAEEEALKRAFCEEKIPFDSNTLDVYRRNNIAQWRLFEQGIIKDKREVLDRRFEETFKELGLTVDYDAVSELYEKYLHKGFYVIDNAESVLRGLQSLGCKLYLVSNGVLSIQNSRMKGSGMDKYFLKRFVSEEIGFPKPHKKYFDYCFANIDKFERKNTLIIGDSLTSDIQGGINSGIDTCWCNPKHETIINKITPTFEIYELSQLFDIVR